MAPLRMTLRSPPESSVSTLVRPAARASRMSRSMAVRLARASRQPRFPQPHFGPPICMTMWPISPADSRAPRQSLPFCTKPAPMPVPTQMPTALRACRAEPSQVSPSVPRLPSLPTATGTWKRPSRCGADRHARQAHVGRDHHAGGVRIDHAGDGDTQAVRSAVATFAFFSTSSMTFSITARTCSGPPVRGVGRRSCWTIPPDSRTNEAWTFVPPTSTPRYKRSLPATVWFFMLLPLLVRTGHSRLPARPMQRNGVMPPGHKNSTAAVRG